MKTIPKREYASSDSNMKEGLTLLSEEINKK